MIMLVMMAMVMVLMPLIFDDGVDSNVNASVKADNRKSEANQPRFLEACYHG